MRVEGPTHTVLQFVELGRLIVEWMMIERDVHLSEKVVSSESIAVPDHHAQRPRLQLALRHVILQTRRRTQTNAYYVTMTPLFSLRLQFDEKNSNLICRFLLHFFGPSCTGGGAEV